MAGPLEQFNITPLIPIHIGGVDLSFTNASFWMLLTVIAASVLMIGLSRSKALVPDRRQNVSEMMYEFIHGMVKDTIGYKGARFMPFVFSIFMTVLLGNIFGMLPFGFTITSHIVVTGALGILVIGAVTVVGFINHGWQFLGMFAPKGLPLPIYLIIIPVEIISFLSRPFTLAVRLCANMTAGHTMLKVFALFSVQMGVLFGLGPMLFNAALVAFELLVAVLQAYIFTILTCIYLKDAVDLHH